jgi:uncharacterized protein (TIGR01655 family)
MKKFWIVLGVLVVVLFAGLQVAQKVIMGGQSYYVQITTEGQRVNLESNQGKPIIEYKYDLPGYDKDAKEKELEFLAIKDRPLKKNAYLKITWNKHKGVTSYEEVQKNEIPKQALEQLESKG